MGSLADSLAAAPLAETLAELIRTPSVNPDEAAMAALVAARLRAIGAEVELVESLPGRHSVGARLGTGDGPALLLNGHLDTVPPGQRSLWRHDPFGAEIEAGALYGRGSLDMKAGLAIMLELATALAARPLRGRLVLHFAIGEERAEPGTRSLLEAGLTAPVGIVVEPTLLRVATAGRGGGALRVRLEGRSGHAGMPEAAANPILALPAVLAALAERGGELAAGGHPLLPAGTLTPTGVHAGEVSNTIPAECEVVVDRRLLPGEEPAEDVDRLQRRLDALDVPGVRARVIAPEHHWPASETDPRSEFAELVRGAALAAGCEDAGEPLGTPYATDVGFLVAAGVEAVVFGPGDVALAHRPDERVELDELGRAARALAGVCESLGVA